MHSSCPRLGYVLSGQDCLQCICAGMQTCEHGWTLHVHLPMRANKAPQQHARTHVHWFGGEDVTHVGVGFFYLLRRLVQGNLNTPPMESSPHMVAKVEIWPCVGVSASSERSKSEELLALLSTQGTAPACGVRKVIVPSMDDVGALQWASCLMWQSMNESATQTIVKAMQSTTEALLGVDSLQT
eukprot:6491537-Amphidinium_carterae.8